MNLLSKHYYTILEIVYFIHILYWRENGIPLKKSYYLQKYGIIFTELIFNHGETDEMIVSVKSSGFKCNCKWFGKIFPDTYLCFAIKKCRELQRKIQNVATRYFPYFLDNAFVKRKLWPVYEIIWAW